MTQQIKKIIKNKIQEIGFNFDPDKLFKKEMISISFNEESEYFPTYDCRYFSQSQAIGVFSFQVRFSIENQYIEVDDILELNPDVEIHILL